VGQTVVLEHRVVEQLGLRLADGWFWQACHGRDVRCSLLLPQCGSAVRSLSLFAEEGCASLSRCSAPLEEKEEEVCGGTPPTASRAWAAPRYLRCGLRCSPGNGGARVG
jgi:hypothetical protein